MAEGKEYKFKRCPECFAHLPSHYTQCHKCGQKVREANKYGIAKKPIDWWGYISTLGAAIAFVVYIWYFFIKGK
ncbi:MAG: hypothetical protein HQK76_03390 [Desulfobacterales bacterium]|nr:hypothetical protein [Desulfobacterales bacterium]